ncbi:MAG: Undecaprenyl-phosphate 4-deoxy-4-formamido-L-arabinose transferase [Bacteroidetes bacterium ADurb.Bin141]|nr:MAG: family 2 glycosyl transferase [Bacteroidetes bacterium OLB10]MCB8930019.1 glycosyltransferase family 2 protein [Bacteroidia bacterium]MCE7954431.1 glycosyltransferase [Bacteroidetes bacterium CHB6]MCW5931773.1 glycosyltransferase family 2 protein [Bacteroidota bacterium]OQB65844.1 MAG: Undecaprenyl-phosphate 4-deoxy-4-formamido-L-arabinose transferase [Bacteroidetes bacterium ADurb.Bin141]
MSTNVQDISVIIPLYNEEESLPELVSWIEKVMQQHHYSYEIIMIDDGSKDDSWKVIASLAEKNPQVRGFKFKRNYGKSAALHKGFEAANGKVVITMDADLQDSPDEIPGLYKMITEDKYDLVSGWKKKRHDPISKTLPSKFFNSVTRKVSGIHNLHDFNCGLKAYHINVVKNIEVYGEMHRYIPVIAKWVGFTKIGEKEVEHRARKYGKTKFGLERFVNGFLDLLSITFVSRFGKKPMHLFGTLGTLMFTLGLLGAAYLGISKIYCVYNDIPATRLTQRPSFYLLLTSMIIGTQLFLAGFLAEMISRNDKDRNRYIIEKEINSAS